MLLREFWLQKIKGALNERRVVWLSGARRAGKTTLCHQFEGARYYDCELPSTRRLLEEPEYFWKEQDSQVVILDEIHRLLDPSNVLKIAHDHFPKVRVIATGSSTLSAKKKFKDTLTDRKRDVWLQPLLVTELALKHKRDLEHRMIRGGLPPAFFSQDLQETFYTDWLDSFWGKDVQELFPVERKTSFLKLAELILRQSGGIFEANSFAGPCEISRQTVTNYLEILNTTLFVFILRPYDRNRANEITQAPKVYGFDTGFVCYSKGWDALRSEDFGYLLEHLVLSELLARFDRNCLYYWRDKQKHEIDFVLKPGRGKDIHLIECKSSHREFDPGAAVLFRKHSPQGRNILVAADIASHERRKIAGLSFHCVPISELPKFL